MFGLSSACPTPHSNLQEIETFSFKNKKSSFPNRPCYSETMDSTTADLNPSIANQPNMPLQFIIDSTHSSSSDSVPPLQHTSSTPSYSQNPNSFHVSTSYPSKTANSSQDDFLSSPIPRGRRRGRPRNLSTPSIQSGSFIDNSVSNLGSNSFVASSSDHFNKARMENSSRLVSRRLASDWNPGNPSKRGIDDVSDEIIVINKDATAEALIALTAGFPADSLTEEEIDFGVVSVVGGIEQVNYILIRNHIIMKWRENVSRWVTKEMFVDIVPSHCGPLLDRAFNYLVLYGYINFGVARGIKDRFLPESKGSKVIVVGAGLAGLAAARQLMSFGFKVKVLEGRRRPGGRVYTNKLRSDNKIAAVDLGGSVLTGTLGNPLGILARQLSLNLHKIRDKCPLYMENGKPIDPVSDQKVEASFNHLLEKVSKLRLSMGDVSQDVSLGAALETFRDAYNEDEMSLFNWHLANLEYANAGLLSRLSLAFWDQDDPYDMGGDHCFLEGGNGRLVEALAEGVTIHYGKTVQAICYGNGGVQVSVSGGQVFEGDMVLCTVPLGVLKNGSIKFIPELPQRKLDGIKRLGFGLLNKVAMLFPHAFWGNDLDTFGHLSNDPSHRGEFFLFYSYATVAGGPLLIGLVAGEAAYDFETTEPTELVNRVLRILKDIYEPKGTEVPNPLQTVCTRWGSDPFCCGSYSHVAVGASGDDYDILAETVGDGRLFFAGEATNRRYPATMHGALLSGFREAANMAYRARLRSSPLPVEKNPSANAHTCASILADLFREPDVEFGSFALLFGRKKAGSMAILRVIFGGHRKKSDAQYSNKLLFEQLQSHFNQQDEFHIYTLLSKEQALELREVRGGDEARLSYLEKVGVKLIGRKGLGPAADSVIYSVKAERTHRNSRKPALPGVTKSKVASTQQQKLIRKAKILRNGNKSSASIANVQSQIASNSSTLDTRTVPAGNGSTNPSSIVELKPISNNDNEIFPHFSNNVYGSVVDKSCSVPQTSRHNSGLLSDMVSNIGPQTSNCSISMPSKDIVFIDDVELHASSAPANSNDLQTILVSDNELCLSSIDAKVSDMFIDSSGFNNQNFGSGNANSVAPDFGNESTSNACMAPSSSVTNGIDSQNYDGDTSDKISIIAIQDNIFEDIMNELLPPSGDDNAAWEFPGQL